MLAGTGLAGRRDRPGLGRHRRGARRAGGAPRCRAGARPRARPKDGRFRLAVDRSFTLAGPRHGRDRHGAVGLGARRRPRHRQPVGPRSARALDQRPEPAGRAGRGGAAMRAGAERAAASARRPCAAAMSCSIRRCTRRPPASTPACACCRPSRGRSASGFRSRCTMRPPRCRAAWSCCATSRSRRARRDYVQLVLERPLAAAAGDRFVVRDTSSSRTVGGGTLHRSARARAAAAHARAARRDRGPGASATRRAPWRACWRAPSAWIDLDAFCRDRALGADAAAAIESDLALVVLPAGAGRVGHAAGRPGSGCARASARRSTPSMPSGRTCPGIGLEQLRKGEKPRAARPRCSWRRCASSPRPARSRSTAPGCAGRGTRCSSPPRRSGSGR